MSDRNSFQRWAAIAAIVSAPLGLASLILPLPAIDYDMATYADPISFLRRGGHAAGVMRQSLLLDLFGYYLLIAPLVMLLGHWLGQRARLWSRLFTGCLLVYVIVGAVGASVLAAASPRLLAMYASAPVEQRAGIEVAYNLLWDIVYAGIWNIFEELIAGVGWLGLGLLLRRERRFAGTVSIALGIACLLDAAGNIAGAKAVADAGLYAYLLLAPAWALGLGVALLRRPIPIEDLAGA